MSDSSNYYEEKDNKIIQKMKITNKSLDFNDNNNTTNINIINKNEDEKTKEKHNN